MLTFKGWFRESSAGLHPDRPSPLEGAHAGQRVLSHCPSISGSLSRLRATSLGARPRRSRLPFRPDPEQRLGASGKIDRRLRNHVPNRRKPCLAALIPTIEGIRFERRAGFR